MFDQVTGDGDVLEFTPEAPVVGVEVVRVVTTSIGDLAPAWREIELLTSVPPE